MNGCSLPVWVVVLAVGLLITSLMGYYSPFIAKHDKKKAKNNKSSIDSYIFGDGLKVKINFHFGEMMYVFVALVFGTAAFILFFIESFSDLSDVILGGGVMGCIAALFSVILMIIMIESAMIVIPFLVEKKKISSIIKQYARSYDARIVDESHD